MHETSGFPSRNTRNAQTRSGLASTGTPGRRIAYSSASSLGPPGRAAYPRMAITGRRPSARRRSTIQVTTGVLPVPPVVMLPTEMTGFVTGITPRPRSNRALRAATAAA